MIIRLKNGHDASMRAIWGNCKPFDKLLRIEEKVMTDLFRRLMNETVDIVRWEDDRSCYTLTRSTRDTGIVKTSFWKNACGHEYYPVMHTDIFSAEGLVKEGMPSGNLYVETI